MAHRGKQRGDLIAALDVGSHKIACFIGRILDDEGAVEVLGVGYSAAKGIKSGTVVDLAQAEGSIRQTVQAAENMAKDYLKSYPLRDVIMNVPGTCAASHGLSIDIQVMGQSVTENDVRRALAKAQDQVLSADYELVHTIPVDYRLDGKEGIRDPRGMVGQNLNVGIHMVTAELGPLQNVAGCIERSHLDIEAICVSSYAAGLASLVEDEMDLGCTIIDMGAGITSFAVFQAGKMIYAGAVPVGGWHVTNDIARVLNCSTADAERIKTLYGSAISSPSDDNEMIDVPQLGDMEQRVPNNVPRSLLNNIIRTRVEEILDMARTRLDASGLGAAIGKRVVLTGGACQLPGMREIVQNTLNKQVRIGRPIRLSSLPDAVSSPAFSTVAGLMTYVTQRQEEMPAEIMAAAQAGSLWERLQIWFKENW